MRQDLGFSVDRMIGVRTPDRSRNCRILHTCKNPVALGSQSSTSRRGIFTSECHGVTDPAIGFTPSTGLNPALKRALTDILGGSAASVLTVTFGLSYSLLIFAGPLSPYLSYGITATFVSSAVLAAVVGLGSSLPFAIAAPDSSTAAVTGILAASVVERIETANLSAPLLSPVLITLGLSTMLTGIGAVWTGPDAAWPRHPLRALSGGRRLPRRHRTSHRHGCGPGDHRPSAAIRDAVALRQPHHRCWSCGAACAMALVLYLTWHRSRSPFGLPIILVGGVLTAHLAFWITGVSFDRRAQRWAGRFSPRRKRSSCCPGIPTISPAIPGLPYRTCSAMSSPSSSSRPRARCSTPPASRWPRIAKPIWSVS